eukprot:IDg5126t1
MYSKAHAKKSKSNQQHTAMWSTLSCRRPYIGWSSEALCLREATKGARHEEEAVRDALRILLLRVARTHARVVVCDRQEPAAVLIEHKCVNHAF